MNHKSKRQEEDEVAEVKRIETSCSTRLEITSQQQTTQLRFYLD